MLRRKIWRRKKRILVHFKSGVKYNLACKSATMYRCVRNTTYKERLREAEHSDEWLSRRKKI